MTSKLDSEYTTQFPLFLRHLLGEFDTEVIDQDVLYTRTKDYFVHDTTRPALRGEALEQLDQWITVDVKTSKTAYGELVNELYSSYKEFHKTTPSFCLISRKNFPNALLFVLRNVRNVKHTQLFGGRKAHITGISLKLKVQS